MSLWSSYYYFLLRQQGFLSKGPILCSKPWKLSLNWLRPGLSLFVQSLAQQTPAYDLVLMCSGGVEGQIPMSEMNFISYCKALSSPCLCSGTEKIFVRFSHKWLFGAYTALTGLFTEAVSYFCLQTSLVTLLNIAPLIITIFQPYQSHCDCFLLCFSCVSMTDISILKNFPFIFQPEYQYLRNKQVILLIEIVCVQKAFYFLFFLVF